MVTQNILNTSKTFILASLLSLVFSVIWIYIGEGWEVLGDGVHYIKMYNGEIADSPFGFRILTPFLASLLPFGDLTNFAVITLSSLSITSGVFMLYINSIKGSNSSKLFVFIFWITSFPFIYYGTTFVRADAPMLLLIALVILLSRYNASSMLLLVLLSIGTLSHEMVMVVIPALWLDKFFSGSITGGAQYKYRQLLFLTLGTLFFYIMIRLLIVTNISSGPNYLNSPFEMFDRVIQYSGGMIKHILRIYASFGPVFLFSIFYICFIKKNFSDALSYIGLLLIVFAATFLGNDTIRIMAIFYFPIIIYASSFLFSVWSNGYRALTMILLSLQIFYSFIVYLHLRTFEPSFILNIIAASISIISLLISLWIVKKRIIA